ncbi:hypothetical protein EDF88_4469 [Buttiauxella sp. BIGb0552]|jgi:hypothetical protein|uniref:hypothetical protein n=1 Tax=Enterobacterales TaxID=91347 RepID=UPI0010D208DC|nr:hypothetical protein [Buttiauxella sp. BIGb0552]TDX11872.1 hypothetical protein EDF88_4469 [Buttiauxella sp. BIGb0552]
MAVLIRKVPESTSVPEIIKQNNEQHSSLCLLATRYLRGKGFKVTFDDRLRAWSVSGELPDALGFRNGVSCLIEVKCSRADFLADRKKNFRIHPEMGMGDWRFYLCEPDIITPDDLPPGWGLLYADGNKVRPVTGWPGNGEWISRKPFSANIRAERDYLYSALRRLAELGYIDQIYKTGEK